MTATPDGIGRLAHAFLHLADPAGTYTHTLTAPVCTCYLGDPDDPTRDEEACTACDAAYWENPVFILADEPAADDPDGDPRNDHHVARDNELSGQNAEWDRLEELGQ